MSDDRMDLKIEHDALEPNFKSLSFLTSGALDFMGPFSSSFQNMYILVALDYVSK